MTPIRPLGAEAMPALNAPQVPKVNAQAAETAREFEAVFLGQMARMMLESVEMGDEFSGGHGEEIFRGVLAEHLGSEMAAQGGIGIAPMVLDHIIRLQGNTNGQ